MTWAVTTKEQLARLSDRLLGVATSLRNAIELMEAEKFPEMHTHLASADTAVSRCVSYANDVTRHLENQIYCAKSGEVPEWQKSHQRSLQNKLRNEHRATQEHLLKPASTNKTTTKPAKKSTKKATKKASRRD